MTLDPAIGHLLAGMVALVFAVGAVQKLRDVPAFHGVLLSYELVPPRLLRPLAWAVPLLEAASALLLVLPASRPAGAVLGLAVLGLVTAGVAVNLLRGRTDLGCGCGGLEDEQTLSWSLVGRNGVLATLLASGLVAPAARPLAGLDFLTIVAGSLVLYGLYVGANQLMANHPRLWRLRHA